MLLCIFHQKAILCWEMGMRLSLPAGSPKLIYTVRLYILYALSQTLQRCESIFHLFWRSTQKGHRTENDVIKLPHDTAPYVRSVWHFLLTLSKHFNKDIVSGFLQMFLEWHNTRHWCCITFLKLNWVICLHFYVFMFTSLAIPLGLYAIGDISN